MNNHKNTILHQLESFLKIPLALLKDYSQRTAVNCPCCMSFALLGVYLKKINLISDTQQSSGRIKFVIFLIIHIYAKASVILPFLTLAKNRISVV